MFPNDEDVKAVAEAMFDPFEYLMLRNRDGLLKTEFAKPLGKVSYHIPCHLRVQNIGQKTRELLQMIPGTKISVVERCSGHDGTWGVKSEHFAESMKIGKPVFRQMAAPVPDYISSDCAIAARHIEQGMDGQGRGEQGRGEQGKSEQERGNGAGKKAQKQHPLTLLRIAYGLE